MNDKKQKMVDKIVLFKYKTITRNEIEKYPEILKNKKLDRIRHITDEVKQYLNNCIVEENKLVPDLGSYVKRVCNKERLPAMYMVFNDAPVFEDLIGKKVIDYVATLKEEANKQNNTNIKVYYNVKKDETFDSKYTYYLVVLDNGDICLIKEHDGNIQYINTQDKFVLMDYVKLIDLTPQINKDIESKLPINKLILTNDELDKIKKLIKLPKDLHIGKNELVYITKIKVPHDENAIKLKATDNKSE